MRALALTAALLLAACAQPREAAAESVADARETVAEAVAPAVVDVQVAAAEALVPVLVGVREAVQEALPLAPAEPAPRASVSPAAVALIVRWEITSPGYYTQRLQRPVWPGGASGVTWGVGYDGGHQARGTILRDWQAHPAAAELANTAGHVGQAAKAALPAYRHILTPFPLAEQVFTAATLPAYEALAARTFRNGWDALPADARGALTSTVYNRGAAMGGDRRREMRALRDETIAWIVTLVLAGIFFWPHY